MDLPLINLILFRALNEEEALEDLKKSDKDKDGQVTWVEYLDGEHSYTEEEAREVMEAKEDDKDLKDYREVSVYVWGYSVDMSTCTVIMSLCQHMS